MKNKSIFGENRIKIYIIAGIICIICIILLKPVILAKVHEIIARCYSAELVFKDLDFNYPRQPLSHYQNAIGKTITSLIWGFVITVPVFLIFYLSLREVPQIKTGRVKGILSVFLFIWLIEANGLIYYQASNLKFIYKDFQKSYAYRYKEKIPAYEFIKFCKEVIPAGSKYLFLGKGDVFAQFRYFLYPCEIILNLERVKIDYVIIYRCEDKDLKEIIGERKIYKKWVFDKDEYVLGVTETVKKK